MSFLSSMDIAGSGLTAGRLRMDVISENIANSQTPNYRRKEVVYEAKGNNFQQMLNENMEGGYTGGVRVSGIVEDPSDLTPVYDPDNPQANAEGYVMYPNVDTSQETLDMMSATRAYDMGLNAVNAIKQMASKALDIGK